ncbi:hypothetical protein [Pseudorhodoferax sp.]|uniref:hypothetical protein n=1 Tax=Pseudorhodoferax sp. TaxID=1993553 RepID=UPI0039E4E0D7
MTPSAPPFEGSGFLTVFVFLGSWGAVAWIPLLDPTLAFGCGAALAAVLNWLLGRHLNRRGLFGRLMGDRAEHRILGVPMQWFSVVYLLMAFVAVSTWLGQRSGAS